MNTRLASQLFAELKSFREFIQQILIIIFIFITYNIITLSNRVVIIISHTNHSIPDVTLQDFPDTIDSQPFILLGLLCTGIQINQFKSILDAKLQILVIDFVTDVIDACNGYRGLM